jgi:S-methylmethionine-dependent homocysteine/selenocysteine methylase
MLDQDQAVDSRYQRVLELIGSERCVVLDGAIGTELIDVTGAPPEVDEQLWGTRQVIENPARVKAAHLSYVQAGCDVISTATWGLPTAVREHPKLTGAGSRAIHWMDVARHGVRLARMAAEATRSRSRSASTATSTRRTDSRRSACSPGRSRTSRPT